MVLFVLEAAGIADDDFFDLVEDEEQTFDLAAEQPWENLIEIPYEYQASFTKGANIKNIVPFNYLDKGSQYFSHGDL